MAESVPDDLRDKFREMVLEHIQGWHGATPEPLVSFGLTSYPISVICNLVIISDFADDQTPDDVAKLISAEAGISCAPLIDDSYHGGANYIRQIIKRRQADFKLQSSHSRALKVDRW